MEQFGKIFELLREEAYELCIGTEVIELQYVPEALEFARDYYAKQQPVVIRNAIAKWPAIKKWSPQYLTEILGDELFKVAVTPNGYADGLATRLQDHKEYFVLPCEEEMTFAVFAKELDKPTEDAVYYIQNQNSNFTNDMKVLLEDIDVDVLKFATETFNKPPDAINFWMGDKRAITSMHKDPYDNLYCVISGSKDFILVPPHQTFWLPKKLYPTGVYKRCEKDSSHFYIDPVYRCKDKNEIMSTEWISINPLKPNFNEFPQYRKVQPVKVRVNAGDLLFLPNYWFHHVQQTHKCIAVNFWFDMEYDSRYCYFRMMDELSKMSYSSTTAAT